MNGNEQIEWFPPNIITHIALEMCGKAGIKLFFVSLKQRVIESVKRNPAIHICQ